MTSRSRVVQQELDDLGALPVALLRFFLLILPIGMFSGLLGLPHAADFQQAFYALPAFGALVIAPRRAIVRIPVSITLTLLLVWMGMSLMWTVDSTTTLYSLRQELFLALGVVIAAGLLPVEETFRWFLRGIKLLLLISLIAVAVDPGARSTIEFDEVEQRWEAWFTSKNQLGRFAVLALMSVLVLDERLVSKLAWSGIALFLVIGSGSATSLAAVFVVLASLVWVRAYQRVGDAWNGIFVLASLFGVVVLMAGAFVSVAAIVEALGRDLTFTGRTEVWDALIPYIEDQPWLGYGYDALWTNQAAVSRDLSRDIGYQAAHAHNGALNVAAALGLPGLVLFFGLFMSTLTLCLRNLRTSDAAVWVFIFLVLQLLFGSVESTYLGDWLGLMIISRLTMAKLQRARQERVDEETAMLEVLRPTFEIDLDADPDVVRT